MGDTDDAADDQTGTAEMAALAVPAAVLFVLLAYPPVGIIRGVLGKRGVPLSPLLSTPLMWAALMAVMRVEPAVRARPDWSRIEQLWYWGVAGLIAVPAVIGVSWPVPVLRKLSPAATGALCYFAPSTFLTLVYYARRR